MRIILNEMKKIWNWKLLAIIVIVSAMFYIMFMSYYIDHYKHGNHPHQETVFYAEELTRLYGVSITAEELADYIAGERALLIERAEGYFQTMPIFSDAGIYSFDDYTLLRERQGGEISSTESNAHWTLLGEECDYLGFKLQSLEYFEERYDFISKIIGDTESYWSFFNEKEKDRYAEIVSDGENRSILIDWTLWHTESYAFYLSILLMLAVLALVSPLLVSDRHGNMHYLQYSSKLGRRVMRVQLVATLLSALMLTTLMILIFGVIFSANGTHLFWYNNMNSDFSSVRTVFSMTYGGWVVAAIIFMYVLTLGVSMLAFVLSRFSGNLITLVMKLIPVFAALVLLCIGVFNGMFCMGNKLYQLLRIFGVEVYVCGIFVVVAFAAAWSVLRRERRVDVA